MSFFQATIYGHDEIMFLNLQRTRHFGVMNVLWYVLDEFYLFTMNNGCDSGA